MSPPYRDGDYLLTRRYRISRPRVGDDVVFTHPDFGPVLKRIARIDDGWLTFKGLNALSADTAALGRVSQNQCGDLNRVALHLSAHGGSRLRTPTGA